MSEEQHLKRLRNLFENKPKSVEKIKEDVTSLVEELNLFIQPFYNRDPKGFEKKLRTNFTSKYYDWLLQGDTFNDKKKCLPNRSGFTKFKQEVNTPKLETRDLLCLFFGYAGWEGFCQDVSIKNFFDIDDETEKDVFENMELSIYPTQRTLSILNQFDDENRTSSAQGTSENPEVNKEDIENIDVDTPDNHTEISNRQTNDLQNVSDDIKQTNNENNVARNKNKKKLYPEPESVSNITEKEDITKSSGDSSVGSNKGKKKNRKIFILILFVILFPGIIYLKYGTKKSDQIKTEKPIKNDSTQTSNVPNLKKGIIYSTKKDSISWGRAKKEYSIESYRRYLTNFPNGVFAKLASNEIQLLRSFGIEMVYIDGGTFLMGCNKKQNSYCDENETPEHKVTISKGYYIAKFEVTQKLWKKVMGSNPSGIKGELLPVNNFYADKDIPVFIRKLNELTRKNYRLPTEAEWEFAARGGNNTKGYLYSGSNEINSVAWNLDNAKKTLHQVGEKEPNELGLYDMSGNVWEFVSDDYDITSGYLGRKQHEIDPHEKVSGGYYLVFKGGGYQNSSKYCRVSVRNNGSGNSPTSYGLRLALDMN